MNIVCNILWIPIVNQPFRTLVQQLKQKYRSASRSLPQAHTAQKTWTSSLHAAAGYLWTVYSTHTVSQCLQRNDRTKPIATVQLAISCGIPALSMKSYHARRTIERSKRIRFLDSRLATSSYTVWSFLRISIACKSTNHSACSSTSNFQWHFLQSEFLRKVSVRRPFPWYCFYTDKSAPNNDQRGAPPPLLSSSVHCHLSFWSAQWCPPKNLEKWTPEWRETSKEWFSIEFRLLRTCLVCFLRIRSSIPADFVVFHASSSTSRTPYFKIPTSLALSSSTLSYWILPTYRLHDYWTPNTWQPYYCIPTHWFSTYCLPAPPYCLPTYRLPICLLLPYCSPTYRLPIYWPPIYWLPIYRLPIYWLPIYWLPIYWLPIYWLQTHHLPIYWLSIYWLPNYQLPIYWLSTYCWLPIYQTALYFQSIDRARTSVHQALSSF